MKLPGYYSCGQFAQIAGVSVRTIRFYDRQNILKPSYVNPKGARFYTDSDLVRLQQILLFKYLGFSLDEIREMTIDDADYHFMLSSLGMQLRLVEDRMEQLSHVRDAIVDTTRLIERDHQPDWSRMLHLIHLTSMEKSLASQYQNATNLSARIRLHTLYASNSYGWFPWIYDQCAPNDDMKILEVGCGDGSLWRENLDRLPKHCEIVLSDISDGMVRDARRSILSRDLRFSFRSFDAHHIPFEADTFDLVIANHVLFYCDDIPRVCREVRRVLKPGGVFVCSTYSKSHMQEIVSLVQSFDEKIVLSGDKLYERFGLENGALILENIFSKVDQQIYDDSLLVTDPEPLIEYVLSCHGNQNRLLLDRYKEFRSFVTEKTRKGFYITKDAGVFVCRN